MAKEKTPPPPMDSVTQAINLLAESLKPKKQKNKVSTSRNHSCVTYILDIDELTSILNRECVHHWAVSPVHDKDVWTDADEKENPNHKSGESKTAHRHLIVVFKDAKTTTACEKWFDRFSRELSVTKGLDKFEHTKAQICNDVCMQYRYMLHLDDPQKHRYSADGRIVDDVVYWLNVDNTDGQSADNLGRQMLDDMLSGKTVYDMVCTYGKEYIYHKKHLESVKHSVMVEQGLLKELPPLDDWLIDAYLKSANFDNASISLFHKMLEVVISRYEIDLNTKINNLWEVYLNDK